MKSGNEFCEADELSSVLWYRRRQKPGRYHIYSLYSALRLRLSASARLGNDSGKVGELSKVTAVFPPVDKFLTVRKRKKTTKKGEYSAYCR